MSVISIQEYNADKKASEALLNQDSKNLAVAAANIKRKTGKDIKIVNGKLRLA